mmetsp:Transcript_32106/g.53056  ORF Transcript_32106/g.53056 Transcript_32106/m.53056 type:complete len:229 (+) Transcript_32106:319-1005(+)
MPPNVKETVAVVDHLATLNKKDLVDPKHLAFAPLTAVDVLSASHIEANLVAESRRLQKQSAAEPQKSDHDDYWAEAHFGEKEAQQSVAKEQLFQQRLAEKKQLLNRIMYEEEIRQMLQIQHIEHLVRSQPLAKYDTKPSSKESDDFWSWRNENEASGRQDPSHENHSYWEWPTLSREEEKQQLIQKILKDEEIREQLSISHVEEQLKSAVLVEQTVTSSHHDDAYWSW